jgi:hypothetical protein
MFTQIKLTCSGTKGDGKTGGASKTDGKTTRKSSPGASKTSLGASGATDPLSSSPDSAWSQHQRLFTSSMRVYHYDMLARMSQLQREDGPDKQKEVSQVCWNRNHIILSNEFISILVYQRFKGARFKVAI